VLKAVSADTHKATAKMHQMLSIHFDADEGRYSDGWDDERISKESGISVAHVSEVRNIAYGEIKEPEEVTKLRADIKSLNELISETLVTAQKEVNALNSRVNEITKKLGIKL
jgi:vacuolar-type H+-ATPase subunit I/STV1